MGAAEGGAGAGGEIREAEWLSQAEWCLSVDRTRASRYLVQKRRGQREGTLDHGACLSEGMRTEAGRVKP